MTFQQLKDIWHSRGIQQQTKTRIFNSKVKSVQPFCIETWRMTKTTINTGQTSITSSLRVIFYIHWTDKIRNCDLWTRTQQLPAAGKVGRKDWAHTVKASVKHQQTGFDVELSREEEKREAKEHPVTGSPDSHQETTPAVRT